MKFVKRPVVIEAYRYGFDKRPGWFVENLHFNARTDEAWLTIHTLEGDMRAMPGDFIIKGVQGEIYPCKAEIFEATYEKLLES